MSVAQTTQEVEVEFPEEWKDGRVSEEDIERIEEIANESIEEHENEDYAFEEFIIKNDSDLKPGVYLGREEEGHPVTNIDLSRTSLPIQTFAHEQGHNLCYETCESILKEEDSLTEHTLNELLADIHAWKMLDQEEIEQGEGRDYMVRRSPFNEVYREGFEALAEVVDIEDREEELSKLKGIQDSVDSKDKTEIYQKIKEMRNIAPEFKRRGDIGIKDDAETKGMFVDGFKSVINFKDSQAGLEDLAERIAPEEVGGKDFGPFSLLRKEWRDYKKSSSRSSSGSSKAIDEALKNAGYNEIAEADSEVEFRNSSYYDKRDEVNEVIEENEYQIGLRAIEIDAKSLEEELSDYIGLLENSDIGQETYERIKTKTYGSGFGDVDFPHEIAGITAQILNDNGYDTHDVIENAEEYAELCREAIKDTIEIGLELAEEGYEEWNNENTAEYEQELRDRIEQKIYDSEGDTS